ncbi:4-hydroxy-tetrahydrodipicolinate reductase [Nonlabens agnitus]|uniref:4-hydroxy-tetrahydrodipicolinate reductase n=1 Tax=Nonlabens agnitus TaxID=870484 RepID=A0A2S9WSU7_9FLAO|nr:4-hydroxy-tetrahydrodipicolinate reductase [Nonlabens agnitus]PRP66562.1 4-hydroxy-tetrahydrodipicolinate reductase [Nonlabens agnitus]
MKIGLLGYGKMGKVIERIAQERGHEIVARINKDDSKNDLEKSDVVIEFTAPESALENLKYCINKQIPIICGTTGWNSSIEEIYKLVSDQNAALVHASNFSLGVNLFFELNKRLAALMEPFEDYQLAVQEIHHTEKADAPSGTAITLAEGIMENTHFKGWHLGKENEKDSIGIEALREHDVKGTHLVSWNSDVDQIEIKHTAHSRDGFALGAVIAAEWLLDKKGSFTMKDVLGL